VWEQLMMPIMGKSVGQMLDKWSMICNSADSGGKLEIEVSECFQNLTEEVITRTVFGSSFDAGKKIFQLQAQQILFAAQSFQTLSFPGSRLAFYLLI